MTDGATMFHRQGQSLHVKKANVEKISYRIKKADIGQFLGLTTFNAASPQAT